MDWLVFNLESLWQYPQWFVVACATIVAALLLWLLAKVLKWTLYLLVAVLVIGGGAAALWLWIGHS